ncbi:MAG: alpha-L-arabinofuranosidase C-terminal domain-containing protein [Pirellulales bacterium]
MNRLIYPTVIACLGAMVFLAGPARAEAPAVQTAVVQAAPSITIDAAKTGEPISKYVYGQFIEHLGRCIYGGIWAEMLQDRKFFDAVGAKGSPWKLLGNGKVVMNREAPFVGEHSPQITTASCDSEAGLVQAGLALQKGKKYVGRIWLAAPPQLEQPAPIRVSLVWGTRPEERQTMSFTHRSAEFAKYSMEFQAGADTEDGKLEIIARGHYRVGTVSLMPANNVHGMRADTLALLKELDSPVYRWPGGNFVSGYNWKDGIGDPDRRPPRKNPAWQGIEHNDFGIDEFMVFCALLKTDPYIAVNSGLGDSRSAIEEVQYANGAADTPMGKLRDSNGHAAPYGVKFWSIGNEMYGNWQLGHMTQDKYMQKHNEFADAMRAVDPSIKLVAVGDAGRWSEEMLKNCADHMDLISEHFYCQERPDLAAHVAQIPRSVFRKAEAHRDYRKRLDSLKGHDIRIALDEWNYWYGPHVFGELGTRYFVKDGLGIAAGLHEMARQSDLFYMANYAQTVNVIGCIKTNKTAAALETTGLVLKLYRHHFGVVPVATQAVGGLDAQAAWSQDRKTLTVGIVNVSRKAIEVPLVVKGAQLSGSGTRWQIAGKDPMAYNDPANPSVVTIEESPVTGVADKLTVAPLSVTLFSLGVK